ncbi:hypothetical protein TRVL_09120 [Trypanosoma vivax]|nr:hypothetical protein TRVL_09120 [Trypanosoma vivax]
MHNPLCSRQQNHTIETLSLVVRAHAPALKYGVTFTAHSATHRILVQDSAPTWPRHKHHHKRRYNPYLRKRHASGEENNVTRHAPFCARSGALLTSLRVLAAKNVKFRSTTWSLTSEALPEEGESRPDCEPDKDTPIVLGHL